MTTAAENCHRNARVSRRSVRAFRVLQYGNALLVAVLETAHNVEEAQRADTRNEFL
jgi:hypothetical protein